MFYIGAFLVLILLIGGCALAGPPPPIPPALGGPAIMGLGWIILGLIAVVSVFVILKNSYEKKPKNEENIVKALNDINERLKKLEEDVKQIKNKK